MDIKKIIIQAIVGGILFTIVSVILNGSYEQEVWMEKGMRGAMFVVIYGAFLVVMEKFVKRKNK